MSATRNDRPFDLNRFDPEFVRLARAFLDLPSDEHVGALVARAFDAVPRIGWDAPYTLLAAVTELQKLYPERCQGLAFTNDGMGPFCVKHGAVFCPAWCAICDWARVLADECIRLSGESP